ncbi:hypothetical protein M2323_002741 [Rhodoblastus acidophilus]|uniref:hypothetical protein n=1 Tax=Rhodoblastus acidophilus TaxID=1074 RepID=UPI0022249FD5|nr:hypothetical protein [Rhodoblastus acidophilus]MCW2284905.1 hypothetical protein [Rhodoblastus acidophilus]MCW2333805.1 hypothetical protein [Rhodoblastus acidophilus]
MTAFNRPPLRSSGLPAPSAPPQAIDNPCAYLPQLRAALYALLSGAQSQQIRDGDRWRSTQNGNAKELRAEIRKLEIMCDPRLQRRAVRAGPYVPADAVPGYGYPFGFAWPY